MTDDERNQELEAIRRQLVDACGRISALGDSPEALGPNLDGARGLAHQAATLVGHEKGPPPTSLPWGPVFDEIERRRTMPNEGDYA